MIQLFDKMTKYWLIPFFFTWICLQAQVPWQPAAAPLMTRWAEDVRPENPLPEYPRPNLVRKQWINLNGLWKYAVVPAGQGKPLAWKGDVLVPFCIESALSGVAGRVSATEKLWYERKIKVPASWKKQRVLLHFEAVDWETEVWIDDQPAGTHRGGYDPFSLDITALVKAGSEHRLTVSVRDPTDKEYINPRGKQVAQPGGIFYTPVTGIWQTVWLEAVPDTYIQDYQVKTDIYTGKVTINLGIEHPGAAYNIAAKAVYKGKMVAQKMVKDASQVELTIPMPQLWSPEHPHLYELELTVISKGKKSDKVKGYFGMREVRLGKVNGFARIVLNDSLEFMNGPLDQGFWPDGIYTAPTDEALRFDIEVTKAMGFNMLRKHVKVESRRFYYWCDKMGIWVWQDMPSTSGFVGAGEPDLTVNEEHRQHFLKELGQLVTTHFNHPSIVMWVVFNEGWGQHNTKETTDFVKLLDPSRLVSNASGWEDRSCGDILDIHHYPEPTAPAPQSDRATVLGEYGGLGLAIPGHTWQKENWGYQSMSGRDQLLEKYEAFTARVHQLRDNESLSACVYTQTTDVETETNGLMTYDRAIFKITPEEAARIHAGFMAPFFTDSPDIFIDKATVAFESTVGDSKIYYTTDGSTPAITSKIYNGPFTVSESCVVKAMAQSPASGGHPAYTSRVVEKQFAKTMALPSLNFFRQPDPGLMALYYEGEWDMLPDFNTLVPVHKTTSDQIGLKDAARKDLIGLSYRGYITVPKTGVYTFYVTSDDGSRLTLDKKIIIDNDGLHGAIEKTGYMALQTGYHEIRLDFFEKKGGEFLEVMIAGPDLEKQVVPGAWFYH